METRTQLSSIRHLAVQAYHFRLLFLPGTWYPIMVSGAAALPRCIPNSLAQQLAEPCNNDAIHLADGLDPGHAVHATKELTLPAPTMTRCLAPQLCCALCRVRCGIHTAKSGR